MKRIRITNTALPISRIGWMAIFAVAVLSIIFDLLFNQMLDRNHHIEQKANVALALGSVRARLEERINSNLFLVVGMGAHIAVHPGLDGPDFANIAKILLSRSNALTNMAAAPGFVIKWVEPLDDNETIIGLDYRKIPDQWQQAKSARDSGKMTVAGPVDLIQGGTGLIARIPVYISGSGAFWGLVSSVLDMDLLLQEAGVNAIGSDLAIALRGRDGKGDKGQIFYGEPVLFSTESQAVTMSVQLPSGSWQMAALPTGGWDVRNQNSLRVHLISLLIFLATFLAYVNRSRNKLALKMSEERLKRMAAASHDALIMIDADSIVIFWNPAAETMFGYTAKEAMGRDMHEMICLHEDLARAVIGMERFAKTGTGPIMGSVTEMTGVHKSGRTFPVERSVAAFQHGGRWYAIGSIRDITVRKQYEQKLKELALTDSLTGLSNRRHFWQKTEMMLSQASRYERPFSVMMFDLDHFKTINDTYGHDIGDLVLKKVAIVVGETMRRSDILGRIGGEEFAVAIPETETHMVEYTGERIRKALADVVMDGNGQEVSFTVSIGIAHKTDKEICLDALLKKADEALYKAKRNGRNRVEVALDSSREKEDEEK